MKKQTILAIFTLLLSVYSVSPVFADVSWDVEVVSEEVTDIGAGHCPIVVDSEGNPHIAFSGAPYVRYSSWNGSDWIEEKLPTFGFVSDFVLDDNGIPYILFGRLGCAIWNGTHWDLQTITTDYVVYGSLALDSLGNPHVAYISGKTVYYASQTGSNWTTQTVTIDNNLPEVPKFFTLEINSKDVPYIMYSTSASIEKNGSIISTINLKLATLKDSNWIVEPVLDSLNLNEFGTMAFDSNDNLHFVVTKRRYFDSRSAFLRDILYVHWDGVDWGVQTVATNVTLHNLVYFALGPQEYPHLAYHSDNLIYTRWTGASWESYSITGSYTSGKPVYLALDSKGNPHLAHVDVPEKFPYFPLHLIYATTELPLTLEISVTSPENKTYQSSDVPLTFVAREQALAYYSLDGSANVSITENKTLTGLANGAHRLVVYALDENGNVGAFDTTYFTVEVPHQPLPAIAVAVIVLLVIISMGLIFFLKTRIKKEKGV